MEREAAWVATYRAHGTDAEAAKAVAIKQAFRDVPDASAAVVGIKQTPTGFTVQVQRRLREID
jgi:hypothetical protein